MVDPPTTDSDTPSASPPRGFSGREVGGAFLSLVGTAIVVSGLLINPWVARLVQGPYAVDKLDVYQSYFLWSVGLGVAVVVLGILFGRRASSAMDGAVAFGLPVVLLVLLDRLLLANFGLPLWEHDAELHYRQRPGVVRTLARVGRPEALIRIDRFGHHDTGAYEVAKPPGELRGLMIGDSTTMGDKVTYAETFTAQLEAMLAERDGAHERHEVINTGVHGYTTFQERLVLERALRFDPDFVAIGFCMNDVTEPSLLRRERADGEIDYHGVAAASNPVRGWLMNETGIGRLAQRILGRGKSQAAEAMREGENVRRMASRPADHPDVADAWSAVTADLEAMYGLARKQGSEVVLLIFPFTFQLADPALQHPQRILVEHAARHGVPAIDFTPIFAEHVYDDPELVALLRSRGYDTAALARVFRPQMGRYFLDSDHFSEAGHRVVAERLFEHLVARGLVRPGAGAVDTDGNVDPLP